MKYRVFTVIDIDTNQTDKKMIIEEALLDSSLEDLITCTRCEKLGAHYDRKR